MQTTEDLQALTRGENETPKFIGQGVKIFKSEGMSGWDVVVIHNEVVGAMGGNKK